MKSIYYIKFLLFTVEIHAALRYNKLKDYQDSPY